MWSYIPFELMAEDSMEAGEARLVRNGLAASTDRLDVCEGVPADLRADAILDVVTGACRLSFDACIAPDGWAGIADCADVGSWARASARARISASDGRRCRPGVAGVLEAPFPAAAARSLAAAAAPAAKRPLDSFLIRFVRASCLSSVFFCASSPPSSGSSSILTSPADWLGDMAPLALAIEALRDRPFDAAEGLRESIACEAVELFRESMPCEAKDPLRDSALDSGLPIPRRISARACKSANDGSGPVGSGVLGAVYSGGLDRRRRRSVSGVAPWQDSHRTYATIVSPVSFAMASRLAASLALLSKPILATPRVGGCAAEPLPSRTEAARLIACTASCLGDFGDVKTVSRASSSCRL